MEVFLIRNFRKVEVVAANDTYQFQDYSMYKVPVDLERKTRQRDAQFSKDLDSARALGKRLTELAFAAKK